MTEYNGEERRKPSIFHMQMNEFKEAQVGLNTACLLKSEQNYVGLKKVEEHIDKHDTHFLKMFTETFPEMRKSNNKIIGALSFIGILFIIIMYVTSSLAGDIKSVEKTKITVIKLQSDMKNVVKSVDELKRLQRESHRQRVQDNKSLNSKLGEILNKIPGK